MTDNLHIKLMEKMVKKGVEKERFRILKLIDKFKWDMNFVDGFTARRLYEGHNRGLENLKYSIENENIKRINNGLIEFEQLKGGKGNEIK